MGLLDLLNGTDGAASADPAAAALGATGDAVPGLWARLSSLGANLQNINDGGNRPTSLTATSGGGAAGGSGKGPTLQLYKLGQAMGLKGNDLLTYVSNPEKWAENQASLQGYHDAPQGSTAFFGNPLTNPSAAVHINQTGQRDGQGYSVDGQGAITYGGQLPMSDADTTARMSAQTAASLAPSEIALRNANAAKAGYMNVPQTDNLVQLSGMGGGPPTPSVQGYTGPGATLGDRNNNPFNVKTPSGPDGKPTPWQGQTGVDAQGHAIFSDPAYGMRAGDMNLQAYARHGITTPEAFVDRYVGPDAAPAVKQNYVSAIRGAVGANFDLTDPATRQAIMPAIFHSEGTHTPLPAQGAAPQSAGGPRVVMAAKDPSAALTAGIPNIQGPALLKAIPQTDAATVQQMIDGRLPAPSSFALAKPYWQRMLAIANQVDPTFDAGAFQARAKTRADFTSGKSAQNANSINTAIGHLGTLAMRMQQMQNGQIPLLNAGVNAFKAGTGDPSVGNTHQAVIAVAGEMAKLFKGGVGSQKEGEDWQKSFPVNGSPAQQQDAIVQGVDLLKSRLDAVQQKANDGMGRPGILPPVLSPESAKTLQMLESIRSPRMRANQQLIQQSQATRQSSPKGYTIVGVQ